MSGRDHAVAQIIDVVSVLIELLAVAVIVVPLLAGLVWFLYVQAARRLMPAQAYQQYKALLGKWLLLGLEILVAADVIRTVALEATLENVAALGLLVLVRTFLGWAIIVEIEGRWPWQPARVRGE
jgi:uncharacterized membrane protein